MTRLALALLASTAVLPASALAQANTPTREPGNADEIIVTAQRYEQRVQDVPIAVSVIGAKELEGRGVTSLSELQYSVPGLSTFDTGIGRQNVQLRGISNVIGSATVGFYLDETPLSVDTTSDALDIRLIDLERVEILRGPQATLYGQGSMGGTIRYIPAAPRLDAVTGSISGEWGSTRDGDNSYKAVGVLNVPLTTDVAAVRVAAAYERVGGYIDNAATGEADINRADIYTIRGSFLFRPTEQFSLSLMGLYQESEQRNQNIGIDRRTASVVPMPLTDRYTLLQGKFSYDLGFAELSSSLSYIDRVNTTQYDLTSAFVPALTAPPPFGFGLPVGFIDRIAITATSDYEIFATETRLLSRGDGPLSWQLGVSYYDADINTFGGTSPSPGALPFAIIASDDKRSNEAVTVYGEASIAFTSQLRGSLGLRYSSERRTRVAESTNFGLTSLDIGDATFRTLNPRGSLTYELSRNSMVFASAAKGFRSGGFNQVSAGGGVVPVPPTYRPDEIWTYELGTKHQLFGNRLVLDASVYRSEWSDVQSNNFAPGGILTIVNNSGHVSGWGVDLAVTARPAAGLSLTAAYGWNNLAFDQATADKAVGDPVDYAVPQSWSGSIDYRPAFTSSINGIFRFDYQHADQAQVTLRNQPLSVVRLPARDLVNLRIGAALGPVEVTVFANNLLDEDAPVVIGPSGLILENVEQRPRVIGIATNFRF